MSRGRRLAALALIPVYASLVPRAANILPGSLYIEAVGTCTAVCLCTMDASLHRIVLPTSGVGKLKHVWHRLTGKTGVVTAAAWANACQGVVATDASGWYLVRFTEDASVEGNAESSQWELAEPVTWTKMLSFGASAGVVDNVVGAACGFAGGVRVALALHSTGKLKVWNLDAKALLGTLQAPLGVEGTHDGSISITTVVAMTVTQLHLHAVDTLDVFLSCVPRGSDAVFCQFQVVVGATSPPVLRAIRAGSGNAFEALKLAAAPGIQAEAEELVTFAQGASHTPSAPHVFSAWRRGNSTGVVLNHGSSLTTYTVGTHTSIVLPVWSARAGFSALDGALPMQPQPTLAAVDAFYSSRVFAPGRYTVGVLSRVLTQCGVSLGDSASPATADDLQPRVVDVVHDDMRARTGARSDAAAAVEAWQGFLGKCEAAWVQDNVLLDVMPSSSPERTPLVLRWNGVTALKQISGTEVRLCGLWARRLF